MSWFGQFAGGVVEGIGKGGSAEAEYRDKAELQAQLQAERLLERRESQQARLDQQRELALMREEGRRSSRRSSGGGGGGSFFEMIEDIKTPEQAQRFIASVNAEAGPDAAAQAAEALGVKLTSTVNPTAGDFTRYDRSLNELGQSDMPAPASSTQAFSHDAEKGRIGLQRLLARASGKYKDFAEGEGQVLVNDAVRGAGGDDAKLRGAGAIAMAVEGKDRIGVQGDQVVDKAGVVPVKQTDLGNARAADERADAAKKKASTGVEGKEVKTKEFQALQQERISIDSDLKRAEDTLKELRKLRPAGMTKEQHAAEIAKVTKKIEGWEADKAQVQTRIREYTTAEGERGRGKTPPKADPKPAAAERKVGQTTTVQSGPNKGKTAVWDGKGWKLQ